MKRAVDDREIRQDGKGAFDSAAYVAAHGISGRLVSDVLGILAAAGIVAETGDESGRYVLLRPPGKVTVGDVVAAVADAGTPPEALGLSKTTGPLRADFAKSDEHLAEALGTPVAALLEQLRGDAV